MKNLLPCHKSTAVCLFTLSLFLVVSVSGREASRVIITVPYAKIYNTLNPDSGFTMAPKNKSFVLEHKGKKWYRVWVSEDKTGFVSKAEARIDAAGKKFPSKPQSAVFVVSLVILVLIGITAIVRILSVFLRREMPDK